MNSNIMKTQIFHKILVWPQRSLIGYFYAKIFLAHSFMNVNSIRRFYVVERFRDYLSFRSSGLIITLTFLKFLWTTFVLVSYLYYIILQLLCIYLIFIHNVTFGVEMVLLSNVIYMFNFQINNYLYFRFEIDRS